MPSLVEFLAMKYNNIINGYSKIDRDAENYLLTETLKNGV